MRFVYYIGLCCFSGLLNAQFILPPAPKPTDAMLKQTLFQIKHIALTGNTLFSDQTLRVVTNQWINRDITVSDLETLRYQLTQYYVQRGYINSGAILPKQTIKDSVQYQIVEGKLNTINIQGEGDLNPDYIRQRLQLKTDKAFNMKALQQRFQQLLADPLIEKLNGGLVPGQTLGQSALNLTVERAKPYSGHIFVNNYQAPSTGAESFGVEGIVRNLTGQGDWLNYKVMLNEGGGHFSSGLSFPLTHDLVLSMQVVSSDAVVIEEPLNTIDIDSKFWGLQAGLRQPWVNGLTRKIDWGLDIALRDSNTNLLGEPFSLSPGAIDGHSRVSALRFSQDWVEHQPSWVFALRSTLSWGLDWFDATIHAASDLPDSRFMSWLGQFQYAYHLPKKMQLILRADVQLATDHLLTLEKFSLGGHHTIRGYRENQLVRDQAAMASVSLRYPVWQHGQWGNITMIPFMDYGQGWDRGQAKTELWSAGLGLDWEHKSFVVNFVWADALTSVEKATDPDLQDAGIHLNMSIKF